MPVVDHHWLSMVEALIWSLGTTLAIVVLVPLVVAISIVVLISIAHRSITILIASIGIVV